MLPEGVNIRNVRVNDLAVSKDNQSRNATFLDIKLVKALPPRSKISLSLEWEYTMATDVGSARECVCDSTTYFIAYWYPQIAVYDDLHGWADAPYTGTQEFYNDFNDYKVTIEVPNSMMVWATGILQNPGELLQPAFLQSFDLAHNSHEVVSIWKAEDMEARSVFKPAASNVFVYEAKGVPDFAMGISDHYNYDASMVVTDTAKGTTCFVAAAYHNNSKDYKRVARVAADGIHLMSTYLPGYPFPFPAMTVFNGNDGMEYPMMCNNTSTPENGTIGLTVHEVGHSYFPFMMGIDEQQYAWMDEGWTAFFDYKLQDTLDPSLHVQTRGYKKFAGNELDVPPMVLSRYLRSPAYRVASYNRPQAAYLGLLELLGYDTFHRCMVAYMDRWKGKHPSPYDFFHTFNEVSGTNLNWYWKPWFYDFGYTDLGIKDVITEGGQQYVVVERLGEIPISVQVRIEYIENQEVTNIRYSPAIWSKGETEIRIPIKKGLSPLKIELGNEDIPDVNPANDTWRVH